MAAILTQVQDYFSEDKVPARRVRRVRRWAAIAGALIFTVAVAAVAVTRHIPKEHNGILLRLEFAADANDLRALVPADVRLAVLRAQRDDTWLFVPAYWAVFSAIGMVLVLSGGRINRVSGCLVIAGITTAAVCDWRENAVIAQALRATGQPGVSPAGWAAAKWTLLFLVSGALCVPLLTRNRRVRIHANTTAMLFAVAAVWGVWASFASHGALPGATVLLGGAMFMLALLFIWDSEFFARPS
jgi:hypothetical protein